MNNPYLARAKSLPAWGNADSKAQKLFRSANVDPEENLLSAVQCKPSGPKNGYLMLTSKNIRFVGTMGTRDRQRWPLGANVLMDGRYIYVDGLMFQPAWGAKALRQWADLYDTFLQAIEWDEDHEDVASAPTPQPSGRPEPVTQDPERAKLERALALSREMPPGDLGKSLTPHDVLVEARWMLRQYDDGNLREVWARRLDLGYSLSLDQIENPESFWINACPALAALKLGLKDHPLVATCCGMAEQNIDWADHDQVAAKDQFNALFFGQETRQATQLPQPDPTPKPQGVANDGPRLGVKVAVIPGGTQAGLDITRVERGSIAAAIGLTVGDRVLRIDAVTVTGPEDLHRVMSGKASGDKLEMTWQRNGSQQVNSIQL